MSPRTGRPPVPDDQRKTTVVTVRVSPGDAQILNDAAAARGKKTGPWLVELGLREALPDEPEPDEEPKPKRRSTP